MSSSIALRQAQLLAAAAACQAASFHHHHLYLQAKSKLKARQRPDKALGYSSVLMSKLYDRVAQLFDEIPVKYGFLPDKVSYGILIPGHIVRWGRRKWQWKDSRRWRRKE
ncbi:hypothetical protein HAX54_001631 [Datura stramonium]|uniref:Uncharacterized protein n=1 Tax=Datura stramonium TaxID=4076 RepID=A0ABS8T448_DATST|nr:hypothetical protein [Datura stramonium]